MSCVQQGLTRSTARSSRMSVSMRRPAGGCFGASAVSCRSLHSTATSGVIDGARLTAAKNMSAVMPLAAETSAAAQVANEEQQLTQLQYPQRLARQA